VIAMKIDTAPFSVARQAAENRESSAPAQKPVIVALAIEACAMKLPPSEVETAPFELAREGSAAASIDDVERKILSDLMSLNCEAGERWSAAG
jgi:hypothetical protein